MSITGNLPQASSGAVNIEMGGTTAGTNYDRLAVSGVATLNGVLNVSLINSYTPAAGDTFTIMTYASKTGQFATKNLPALGGGLDWDLAYNATSITATVITRLTVISTDPDTNEKGVPPDSIITVTFSAAVDPATINNATFTISDRVTGVVAYNNASKTATFTPSLPLRNSATYTGTINTGVKDVNGEALASDYLWNFTTIGPPIEPPHKLKNKSSKTKKVCLKP